jgi:membrane protein DedA with SNARE-associated domain
VPHHLTALIEAYGVWLVAGMIALECICIPVPGETILVAAAIYAGTTHDLNIVSVIVAAIIGGIVGNTIAFWLGCNFGYRLLMRYGRYIGLDDSRIKIGQYLFLRYGGKVVFVARFVPLLRSFAAIFAGANRMPWRSFMVANVAGAVAWVTFDSVGAYLIGKELAKFTAHASIAVGLVVLALLALVARLIARHEPELAAQAERALPGPLQPPS